MAKKVAVASRWKSIAAVFSGPIPASIARSQCEKNAKPDRSCLLTAWIMSSLIALLSRAHGI